MSSVKRFECEQLFPWGITDWIHSLRGPVTEDDGNLCLELQMQSGDVIKIVAGGFSFRDP